MSVQSIKGKFPHTYWIDLDDDGTLVECVVLRQDQQNNIYYIQLDKLDDVDKNRLIKILSTRQVETLELWDAMSTVTLGNGMNALKYFHQLVQVITNAGNIMRPQVGKQGVVLVDKNPIMKPTAEQMAEAQDLINAGKEADVKPKPKRRGRQAKA